MTFTLFLAQSADSAASFFFGFGIAGLIVALLVGLLWFWMPIDSLINPGLDPAMKIVWALVIFFLPFIGALAYCFVGRKPRLVS